MENNQEFAIFFSDAPKGKKIGGAFWKMERRACFPIFRIRVC